MPGLRGVVEYRSWSSGRLSAPWAIRRTIRRVRGTDSYPVGNRMARGLCSSYRGGRFQPMPCCAGCACALHSTEARIVFQCFCMAIGGLCVWIEIAHSLPTRFHVRVLISKVA